jgi:hypothetical protein
MLFETGVVNAGRGWGAAIAWHCALVRTDVFRAVFSRGALIVDALGDGLISPTHLAFLQGVTNGYTLLAARAHISGSDARLDGSGFHPPHCGTIDGARLSRFGISVRVDCVDFCLPLCLS